ncbi:MAG: tetraacyldisaccharide 4'-kinase [Planctomycetes bacterium]|nr:tetraacyldisaccharide 4'-kinase [Planctomycetota bacterium]
MPHTFLDLLSGRSRGLTAAALRAGLAAASIPYGLAVAARNAAFNLGLKRARRAAVPVISVGNITAGGTGKTPLVAFLADWYRRRGARVCLLSRGYRSLGAANDEKLVLDKLCPGVPHIQQPDRIAAAERAVRDLAAELLILDDGFQHRRLARDLEIVLVDALCPWGYGRLLPRGLLREPLSALRRAHLVVITRCDQCRIDERRQIVARIGRHVPRESILECSFAPQGLVNADGRRAPLSQLAGRRVAAFCGIGNPHGFRRTLADCGLAVEDAAFRNFPDHHHYTSADFQSISTMAQRVGAAAIVTTEKDLVKLDTTQFAHHPLWAVRIGVRFDRGEQQLLDRLAHLLPAASPTALPTAG